jgi:hypothetical protein
MPSDSAEEEEEGLVRRPKRLWSRTALIILGPVVVGGLFSITPFLYQQITQPTAVLTYTRTTGPAISTANGFRQISTLTVENAGRAPLTGIAADVADATGDIESSAISPVQGLDVKEKSTPKNYHIEITRMLPKDALHASVMTVADKADNHLEMSVRSNEIRGIEAAPIAGDTPNDWLLVAATLLGMFGTLLALVGTLIAVRRHRLLSFTSLIRRRWNREEIITYILALSNVLPLGADTFYQEELSYIRTGDLLLAAGLRGDTDLRSRCVAALRALLDADRDMADSSAAAIRDNLRRLGFELTETDFQQVRTNAADPEEDLVMARRRVAEHFA